ncbi:hypothetical protein CULT_300032 [[Clostridium] ultunense Esp]|nr:hypothetical protein CULT_300032 [[Clostridium] ultunense Esp]
MARELGRFHVNLFEQPLPATEVEVMKEVRRLATVPIALDESIWSIADLMRAIKADALDGIVVKATKMGGILKAKEIGEMAKAHHLQLIGGGLTESRLGFVASAILFHSLGIKTPVDLNGPFFLKDDATTLHDELIRGEENLPTGYGWGVEVHHEKISKYLNPAIHYDAEFTK